MISNAFCAVGGVVLMLFRTYPPLLFIEYSSISDTVNCCQAGKWGIHVHFLSVGVREGGHDSLSSTVAVMFGVS